MVEARKKLCLFRDGVLTKQDINKIIHSQEFTDEIIVNKDHVIRVLERYKNGEISLEQLIEWVNVIWFTDYFVYPEDQSDSISSVMVEIEALDELENEPAPSVIDHYIECLNKNIEL